MDLSKKRKADENGGAYPAPADTAALTPPSSTLTPEDADKILEPLTKDQLLPIVRAALLRHDDVLEAVRSVANSDTTQRKLFIRGLGWETTTDKLREVFSAYGDLDEAIVITDKTSGKSKGYGFVTFKNIDGAIVALREPNKKIDGRITVSQLAAARNSGNLHSVDVSMRKIYVGNVPFEVSSERLLNYFSAYGEIEEGPLGFDKQSGKAKGFAFFVYKTEEGARASLAEPLKMIDGHQVLCKLATDNKKGKQQPGAGPTGGLPMANSVATGVPASNFDVSGGGMGGYGGYTGAPSGGLPYQQQQPGMVHQNPQINVGMGGPGGFGSQGPGSYAGGTVGYGGPGGSGGYGVAGGYGSGTTGGAGDYGGGIGNTSAGPNMYRMPPPTSMGMPSTGGYPDGGNYGLSAAYQPGAGPRPPQGGTYQGMPSYY